MGNYSGKEQQWLNDNSTCAQAVAQNLRFLKEDSSILMQLLQISVVKQVISAVLFIILFINVNVCSMFVSLYK